MEVQLCGWGCIVNMLSNVCGWGCIVNSYLGVGQNTLFKLYSLKIEWAVNKVTWYISEVKSKFTTIQLDFSPRNGDSW